VLTNNGAARHGAPQSKTLMIARDVNSQRDKRGRHVRLPSFSVADSEPQSPTVLPGGGR